MNETETGESGGHRAGLVALAVGAFGIGTSEFSSMGVLQLFAHDLSVDIPHATDAITAYALGVVIGAPLITLAFARANRRTLVMLLMALLIIGNLLSSVAQSLPMLMVGRFISGLPQGAYFGAGAVVATYIVGPARAGHAFALVVSGMTVATIVGAPLGTIIGQHLGWRASYAAFAVYNLFALAILFMGLPRSAALSGNPISRELAALKKWGVWALMIVASLCVASTFTVYTFVGPYVTDFAGMSPAYIPIGLALFGLGMAIGNPIGGRMADRYAFRGMTAGFGATMVILGVMALFGHFPLVLMVTLFAVGATLMMAVPTIPVQMTRPAPEAPTLMGAMNMAAFNVANALGATAGGITISAGLGLPSAIWAGFALTGAGLIFFLCVRPSLLSRSTFPAG